MKRTHPCLVCHGRPNEGKFSPPRGRTRHRDRVCAACRSEGHRVRNGVLSVDLTPFLQLDPGESVHFLRSLAAGHGDSELRRPDHYAGRGGW